MAIAFRIGGRLIHPCPKKRWAIGAESIGAQFIFPAMSGSTRLAANSPSASALERHADQDAP